MKKTSSQELRIHRLDSEQWKEMYNRDERFTFYCCIFSNLIQNFFLFAKSRETEKETQNKVFLVSATKKKIINKLNQMPQKIKVE